jgi:type IV pilus assembly protein PilE
MQSSGKTRFKKACLHVAKGFSLIELMVTVAILGILVSVALPGYSDYIKRGKAGEAMNSLSGTRIKLEQHFQDNREYSSFPSTLCPSATTNFTYNCAVNAADYTLTASGVTGKMDNFEFIVDSAGRLSSTFDGTAGTTCWLTNKGGTC